jgi:aryl-alcohol dehydrogenase-like predicted oxidoreductase
VLATSPFGRTGHDSTRVIFGAAALSSMRQERADEVLGLLLRHGVNHIDVAASYGDAERRVGAWMPEHRHRFFLATKTGERTADGARAELERSLERLRVDAVDLIQLHNLVEPDEWETAHGPGGALEALVRARDEGLVRFIGVTGHGNRIAGMHRRSLARHPFDSVLLPYSFVAMQDPAYRSEVEDLLDLCADRGVAVQTIKAVARRRWPAGHEGRRFSWYEPIDDLGALGRAVRWVLGDPYVFLNTTSDARLLPAVLDAAVTAMAGGGLGGGVTRPDDAAMLADVSAHGVEPLFDGNDLERI